MLLHMPDALFYSSCEENKYNCPVKFIATQKSRVYLSLGDKKKKKKTAKSRKKTIVRNKIPIIIRIYKYCVVFDLMIFLDDFKWI